MAFYVQSLSANFVSAYYRITTGLPQQQKKKKSGSTCFQYLSAKFALFSVLISPNHKARNRYQEMDF